MLSSSLGTTLSAFFTRSHSLSQTITTPVLNPLALSYEESQQLSSVLQRIFLNTDIRYFPTGPSTIEFRENNRPISITLLLTQPILLQPCSHNRDAFHVEVFGEELGKGSYGCVSLSAGRLTPQPDGSLFISFPKHVIKDEKLDNTVLSDSDSEDELSLSESDLEIFVNEGVANEDGGYSAKHAQKEAEMGKIILGAKKAIITDIYDEKHAFIIQEFYEGKTLAEIMDNIGELSVDQRCHLLQAILFAVKKMHALGIIHRDIKPSNILVSLLENDRVVVHIVDVNLAKFIHDESAGEYVGAPLYMPAEAYLDDVMTDVNTDAYSVSIVAAQIFGANIAVSVSEMREINHSFAALFSGCTGLSEAHQLLLMQCIYGLKVGDEKGRFSEDKAIAILDQVIMERKGKALASTYKLGKGLRDSTWQLLQDSFPLLQSIYQKETWIGLLHDDEEIRIGCMAEISERMANYINNLNMLKEIYHQGLFQVPEQSKALSTLVEVLQTKVLSEIRSKDELGRAVDHIIQDYVVSLTAYNDIFLRAHAIVGFCIENKNEDEVLRIGKILLKLLERVADRLAKSEGHSFTLDDMVKMAHKLDQTINKISHCLDEFESALFVPALAGEQSNVSFLSSVFNMASTFFSPMGRAGTLDKDVYKELPKRQYGQGQ